jgi:hypothetical protein
MDMLTARNVELDLSTPRFANGKVHPSPLQHPNHCSSQHDVPQSETAASKQLTFAEHGSLQQKSFWGIGKKKASFGIRHTCCTLVIRGPANRDSLQRTVNVAACSSAMAGQLPIFHHVHAYLA